MKRLEHACLRFDVQTPRSALRYGQVGKSQIPTPERAGEEPRFLPGLFS